MTPEKPSEDGYNWRKYGQKNVKGNEYIKSYYRCSYPNCYVKKQVERTLDGRITDTTYLGNHDHAKPQTEPKGSVPSALSVSVPISVSPPSAVAKDEPSDNHAHVSDDKQPMDVRETAIVAVPDETLPTLVTPLSQRSDDDNENMSPKRRKKGANGAEIMLLKPGHESRFVTEIVSEVDMVSDGYRWRKYGQKMVKGNPNPRSYYRCSTAGCPMKKHVERASHDPKVVISTYEGQHQHNIPIVHQSPAPSSSGKSKLEESDAAASDPPPKCITFPSNLAAEDNTLAIVVTSENKKTSSDHDEGHKASNGDNIDKISENTGGVEVLKSEQKDTVVHVNPESELHTSETNLNNLQRTDAEPVNC